MYILPYVYVYFEEHANKFSYPISPCLLVVFSLDDGGSRHCLRARRLVVQAQKRGQITRDFRRTSAREFGSTQILECIFR